LNEETETGRPLLPLPLLSRKNPPLSSHFASATTMQPTGKQNHNKKKASPIFFVANEKKVSGLAEWKAAEGHTQICFRQQTGIFSVFFCGARPLKKVASFQAELDANNS
jgi:hypothetical protein